MYIFVVFQASNIKMQELQSHVDRLSREKLLAESRINELLPYQNEVGKLKNELMKMQVNMERNTRYNVYYSLVWILKEGKYDVNIENS